MKLGGTLALVAALALTGCAVQPPPVSDKVAAAYASGTAIPKPTAASTPTYAPPAKLQFAEGTKAVFFGDSWTYGQGVPYGQSFASEAGRVLGFDAEVHGGPGTGYLNAGPKGEGTYLTRINALPGSDASLLIMQGSVNDQPMNPLDLPDAVRAALDAAKAKFPRAQVVLVGPARNLRTNDALLAHQDSLMKQVAAERSLNYVSPIDGGWVTPANVEQILDPATNHPSVAGHKTLAADLVAALNSLR